MDWRTAAQSSRVFYMDYANGSNSNDGTAKTTGGGHGPWKTHPYMQTSSACTGTGSTPAYTHQVGDRFIFKGGVTWPVACFQMIINAGGSSTSVRDYYGVDFTWFAGSSFARPKFDMGQQVPSGNYIIYASSAAGHLVFDNLELANMQVPQNLPYPQGCGMQFQASTVYDITVQNSYLHDWMTLGNFSQSGGNPSFQWCSGSIMAASVVHDTEISDANGFGFINGSRVNQYWGGALINISEAYNNKIHDLLDGCHTVDSCHDNEIYNMSQNTIANTANYHSQPVENDFQGYEKVYNNFIHDVAGAGVTILECAQADVFNNVIYNAANRVILLDARCNGSSSTDVANVYNNTIDISNGAAACFGTVVSMPGTVNFKNNHCITSGNPLVSLAGSIANFVQSNNITMSSSTATSQGYTSQNKYLPTSPSAGTVGQGANLSVTCSGNLVSLCFDPEGAPWSGGSYIQRLTTWDVGAYQFSGQSASKPNPPFGLAAVVQ